MAPQDIVFLLDIQHIGGLNVGCLVCVCTPSKYMLLRGTTYGGTIYSGVSSKVNFISEFIELTYKLK